MSMDFKQIDSVHLSSLGFGTWWIGGKDQADYSEDNLAIASIRRAVELGITHIDTAELYGNGHAEELIREAIKGVPREKLFISSKVWLTNLAHDDVLAAAERSLKRLGIDYLDLYMPHWPNPEIPIQETMKAMDQLVEEKKVRHLGLSNYWLKDIKEAQQATKNKIVAAQLRYNLQYRHADIDVIPYCQQHKMFMVAYRPLDKGAILADQSTTLSQMAQKIGKTPAQVALNWVTSHPNVVGLFKTVHTERVDENVGAIGWKLSKEDIQALERDIQSTPFVAENKYAKKK